MITDIKGTWKLRNGLEMPYFGLGVFQSGDGQEVIQAINSALETGYRHIDTASIYQNEKGVGNAVNNSEVGRENIFVTSKVWNSDQGYDTTLKAFDNSLKRLGFDYLDLFLVHWPVQGKYKETWRALEHLYNQGLVKSIGVSNFLIHHLDDLLSTAKITPMVNQVEFHPYVVQQDLLDYCAEKKIQFESWSPLMQGKILQVKELQELAVKYEKNVVQLVLRWNLQKNVIVIPKSVKKGRIESNADIFDFEISAEDISLIDSLDKNERTGAHPDTFDF